MIDNNSKQEAINILYSKVSQYERTEFDITHRYGYLPNKILDTFKGLDYTVDADSTCYDRVSDTPQFKYWYLEIKFIDDKGEDNKIKGLDVGADDYRAQEFPNGSAQTVNTYVFKINQS